MSEFKFALKDRVIVPNTDGVQGVVSARQEAIIGENQYHVSLIEDDLERVCVVYGETVLAGAQPGPMVALELANEMATKARDEAAKELLATAARAVRSVKPKGWRRSSKRSRR